MNESRRIAVLSDVHANAVALRAVLADLDALGIGEIFVAGDYLGFGPDAEEVVDLLVQRGARMIRGNWETDYVAPYGTPDMPAWRLADPRGRPMWWAIERLGPERRAFLAALPDRLEISDQILVAHGSPRDVHDAVLAVTPDRDLDAMLTGVTAALTFVGHTHQPVIRELGSRRVINVGSVGLPVDGDPRASYAVVTRERGVPPECWDARIRRVAYNVDAAVAAYDHGLRDAAPWFAEIMARQLRTARNYFGPWLRVSEGVPAEELSASVTRFLVERA